MTLYVGSTVINVADLGRAIRFWTAALGYVLRDNAPDPDFAVLIDPTRRWSGVICCYTGYSLALVSCRAR